jgi:hypothetical protein
VIDPPSAELLEVRHSMVVAAGLITLTSVTGGVAAYFWARSQRRRPPAARRGPAALIRLLEAGERAQGRTASMGWRGAVALVSVSLYVINMIVFFAFSTWIGGDAAAGRVANGRFFVSSHGHLTEVSETVFNVSLWHTRSVWLTSALFFGLAATIGLMDRVRNRRFRG